MGKIRRRQAANGCIARGRMLLNWLEIHQTRFARGVNEVRVIALLAAYQALSRQYSCQALSFIPTSLNFNCKPTEFTLDHMKNTLTCKNTLCKTSLRQDIRSRFLSCVASPFGNCAIKVQPQQQPLDVPPHLGIYVPSSSPTWSGGTHHRGRHIDGGVRSKSLTS